MMETPISSHKDRGWARGRNVARGGSKVPHLDLRVAKG